MDSMSDCIAELNVYLGDRLSTAPAVLDHHGQNETDYPNCPPDAVVFPKNTQEVSAIVKICAKYGCPIIPWGVGTSLEGHALAVNGGVTVSFERMNKLLHLREADLQAVVQPGLTREALNTELRASGLYFTVDPGANASIGGMAATRASGTTAVRYGTMRDNVLALEVVLADGRIIRTGSAAKKSSAGYDLTHLMIGSEGTLGIITELTVKLYPQPDSISAAVCDFPSVEAAVNAVIMAVQMGLPIARMELLDAMSIRAINAYSKMDYPECPHVFMEFHGSAQNVADQSQQMQEIAAEFGSGKFDYATQREDRERLWKARHNFFYAAKALHIGRLALSTDVCVPISKLAQAIAETQADLKEHGLDCPILGHVGDGNYHCAMFYDSTDHKETTRVRDAAHRMVQRALALGGTCSGEHGIGIGKQKYMQTEHGDGWQVMAQIKRSLDPQNIMNPSKVVQLD